MKGQPSCNQIVCVNWKGQYVPTEKLHPTLYKCQGICK